MFQLVVWGGFFLAMGLTGSGWGLLRMEIRTPSRPFWV